MGKKENGCPLNNIGHSDLIFLVHILGTYMCVNIPDIMFL